MMGFIFVWWIVGMCGGFLLWLNWKWSFPDEIGRCPTRRGALGIFISGFAGPLTLTGSLGVHLTDWISGEHSDGGGWWNKPVC